METIQWQQSVHLALHRFSKQICKGWVTVQFRSPLLGHEASPVTFLAIRNLLRLRVTFLQNRQLYISRQAFSMKYTKDGLYEQELNR